MQVDFSWGQQKGDLQKSSPPHSDLSSGDGRALKPFEFPDTYCHWETAFSLVLFWKQLKYFGQVLLIPVCLFLHPSLRGNFYSTWNRIQPEADIQLGKFQPKQSKSGQVTSSWKQHLALEVFSSCLNRQWIGNATSFTNPVYMFMYMEICCWIKVLFDWLPGLLTVLGGFLVLLFFFGFFGFFVLFLFCCCCCWFFPY